MAKPKQPSKDYKWDASKNKWVLKSFEERQKGRNILLQGKNNPIRVIHDSIRNANAAKALRNKNNLKKNTTNNNLTEKDKEDIRKENELIKYQKNKPKGGYTAENSGPDKGVAGKKFVPSNTKKSTAKSTVHTRHYKTGERLGVMGANRRRAYEKEAAGRTFEGEVAKYEKESGHGKSHLRETLYKSSHRKKKTNKSTTGSNKKKLTVKQQHKSKLNQQQNETAKIMANDPRYKGPKYKKQKPSASRFK
jgi:hypothetical protein